MVSFRPSSPRGRIVVFALAVLGTALIAAAPCPEGLSVRGQYAVATTFYAGSLWVTGALPLAVTALSIPFVLTPFGVYPDLDAANRRHIGRASTRRGSTGLRRLRRRRRRTASGRRTPRERPRRTGPRSAEPAEGAVRP